ncbi:S41 family peptidase [Limnoglobus roseus]|uniref:S41 family peptidase n=1 Tax=Limnoglobus roseus TaxID=2598579 RepID=A0A5C1ATV2_9BACT|nr:S41 family peptidase [Limnoglobus roseus]QEL20198.1 S41 family peptidase [Limnoglobus roseus]
MRHFLLSAVLAAALVAPAARAADEPPPKPSQGRYAVLIGVGEFDDKAIQPRPTADADAKSMYDLLADAKTVGIPEDRIALLTSTPDDKRHGRKATKENILRALHEGVEKTGKDDLLFVCFFGRGAPNGFDKVSFFATESTVADRSKNAISAEEVSHEMKLVKSQRLCVLTDLAFKGFDAGKETLAEPNASAMAAAFLGVLAEGKDEPKDDDAPKLGDKVVILSYLPGNDPINVGDHGLFAKTAMEAMKGAADKDGNEADGVVTIDELTEYLDKEVTQQAQKLGKTTSEKEATPQVVGVARSHFVVSNSPAYPEAKKRIDAFAALTKSDLINKDEAAEGKKYLERMPKLKTPQALRKTYQELVDGKLNIDAFRAERQKLLDTMKLSPANAEKFAKVVFEGAERFNERYVKPIETGTLTAGCVKGLYRRLDEPMPAAVEAKIKEPKGLTEAQQVDLLKEVRLGLGKREDLDDGKDMDLALGMMAYSIEDPYTVYVDRETMRKEESRWKSAYSGIGVHIRRDLARDGLLVVSPIKGSPAYKAGMRAGDLITEVRRELDSDGKALAPDAPKVISLKGMKTDKAIEIILGKPGTPITVVVEREGEKEPMVLDLQRARVSLETVLGVKRDDKDNWNYYLDDTNKIAYVHLTQFGPMTAPELLQVVTKLSKDGMKGMILDLRTNPGGTLGGALAVSDMFLESGLLLKIKPRPGGKVEEYRDGQSPNMNFNRSKFPMVVMVNGTSASASEIVSQTLQDYNRAVVVGERSYGKGSVQTVEDFSPTGGTFKMTIARYFPPLGRNIDKRSTSGKPEEEWGVVPNKGFEIKLDKQEEYAVAEFLHDKELIKRADAPNSKPLKPFKDKQLEAAVDYLLKENNVKDGTAKKDG